MDRENRETVLINGAVAGVYYLDHVGAWEATTFHGGLCPVGRGLTADAAISDLEENIARLDSYGIEYRDGRKAF